MATNPASSRRLKHHHRRTSSIFSSLGSFIASASYVVREDRSRQAFSSDTELVISDPSPPEWADDNQPAPSKKFYRHSTLLLEDEVHLRVEQQVSSITFPSAHASLAASNSSRSSSIDQTRFLSSSDALSPPPSSSSSTFTLSTSPRFSPPATSSKLENDPTLRPQWSTMPRSFAKSQMQHQPIPTQPPVSARTSSLNASLGKRALSQEFEEINAQRTAGFRTRSINSIRGMAAAWVPTRFAPSSRSSDGSNSSNPTSPSMMTDARLEPASDPTNKVSLPPKRPIRLDRRRLDKAVSLAVEAAQVAEQDERNWEAKQTRSHRYLSMGPESTGALGLLDGAGTSGLPRSRSVQQELLDKSRRLSLDDENSGDEDDLGFSLDLYISSLGYLISAMSDRDAHGLNEKQRTEMRSHLEQGMGKLGFDARAELERAEAMRRDLEIEREKANIRAQQPSVVHHHWHNNSSTPTFTRAIAAAKASGRPTSFAGKVGTSMLDIGLTVGAGALSALSANIAAIAPRSSISEESPKITDMETNEELENLPVANTSASGSVTPRTAWSRALGQNSKQWELAVAFASSATSALASTLSAIAREGEQCSKSAKNSNAELQLTRAGGEVELGPNFETIGGQTSPEDRLILLSASLARALKRSPLPSQLYQLLRQLVSLLAALDARYSITERGTQIALQQTSFALRFVRRHELHIKAVRVAWAAAEAAVAALEAYKDEKGWIAIQNEAADELGVSAVSPTC